MRDTPTDPMALYAVALLFGTRVAETILASVHVRAHPQAGHMDASNLIKALQNTLRGGGRPHMGLPRLTMHRAEPTKTHQLRDPTRILAVGLHRHDLEGGAHMPGLQQLN